MSSDSGCILQGEEANLSNLRVADPLLLQAALDQICLDGIGNDDDEANLRTTRLLFGPAAVRAQFNHDDNDDVDEIARESERHIPGMLVVTSEQLLFWQQVNEEGVQPAAAPHYDLSVDAVCIDLHALVNDNSNSQSEDENVQETSPPSAVYIQMSRNDGDEADPGEENDADLMELTIHFAAANDEQVGDDKSSTEETTAQALFEAITKLISMHPINPNDGIDQPDGADSRPTTWYGAEEFGASNGNDQYGDAEDYDDDEEEYYDNDDDMYVASNGNNNSGDQGATEEERNAMLERLDRLLIVPIELEQNDSEGEVELVERGQFDDADDNEIVEML